MLGLHFETRIRVHVEEPPRCYREADTPQNRPRQAQCVEPVRPPEYDSASFGRGRAETDRCRPIESLLSGLNFRARTLFPNSVDPLIPQASNWPAGRIRLP